MTTDIGDFWEDDFDDRVAAIALPIGRDVANGSSFSPAAISLVLLAVGLVLGFTFFVAGLLLLVFCIGLLVWYAGAALLVVVHGAGAVVGLVAAIMNYQCTTERTLGLIGFFLNGVLASLCAWGLLAFTWR